MDFVYTMFTLYREGFKNSMEVYPVKGKQLSFKAI